MKNHRLNYWTWTVMFGDIQSQNTRRQMLAHNISFPFSIQGLVLIQKNRLNFENFKLSHTKTREKVMNPKSRWMCCKTSIETSYNLKSSPERTRAKFHKMEHKNSNYTNRNHTDNNWWCKEHSLTFKSSTDKKGASLWNHLKNSISGPIKLW